MKYKKILEMTEEFIKTVKELTPKISEEVLEERAIGQLSYNLIIHKLQKKFNISEEKAEELGLKVSDYNIQDERDVMELAEKIMKEEE